MERKPAFTVDDSGAWLGSQLEHPGESAGLTPHNPLTLGMDGSEGIEGDDPAHRTPRGMIETVLLLTIVVLFVAATVYVRGAGR